MHRVSIKKRISNIIFGIKLHFDSSFFSPLFYNIYDILCQWYISIFDFTHLKYIINKRQQIICGYLHFFVAFKK